MSKQVNKTIEKRQDKYKEKIIENLKKFPIVQVACERTNIARATYYRWLDNDEKFAIDTKEAITEGEKFINDMSESQLISLIKAKNLPAINLWLKNHHQRYGNKLEITGKIKTETEQLSSKQEEILRQAIKLAGLKDNKKGDDNNG